MVEGKETNTSKNESSPDKESPLSNLIKKATGALHKEASEIFAPKNSKNSSPSFSEVALDLIESGKEKIQAAKQWYEREHGFNGTLTSPDGKQSLAVTHGEMKNSAGIKTGTMKQDGHVLQEKAGNNKLSPINVDFEGWKFTGEQDGKTRVLTAEQRLCQGEINFQHEGKDYRCHTVAGMLIDTTSGSQLGLVKAPREDAQGQIHDGQIILFGTNQNTSKNQNAIQDQETVIEFRNCDKLSFNLRVMGETGLPSRPMSGIGDGDGIIINMRDAKAQVDKELKDCIERKRMVMEAISRAHGAPGVGTALNYLEQEIAQKEARQKLIDKIAAGEEITTADRRELKEAAQRFAETKKPTPLEGTSITAARETIKRIELPKLDDEESIRTAQIKMRIGNQSFQVREGQIYRLEQNAGQAQQPLALCGKWSPGYVVEIDGKQIQLSAEERLAMEISLPGEQKPHQIIGLGLPRMVEGRGYCPGGLVDQEQLKLQSLQAQAMADKAAQDYFESKPYLLGDLTSHIAGGIDEQILNQQLSMGKWGQELARLSKEIGATGFDPLTMDNQRLDTHIRTMQILAHELGTEGVVSAETAAHGTAIQKLTSDAVTIGTLAITIPLSAGTLGATALGTGWRIAAQLGTATAMGSGSSLLFRSAGNTSASNLAGRGGIEGLMTAVPVLGQMHIGNMAKLNQVRQVAQVGAANQLEANMLNSVMGKMVRAGYGNKSISWMLGTSRVTENVLQGFGFEGANSIGTQTKFRLDNAMFGSLAGIAGHGTGNKLIHYLSKVPGVSPTGFALRLSSNVSSGYVNGMISSVGHVLEGQRETVAFKLGKPVSALTTTDLISQADWSEVLKDLNNSGSIAGFTALLGSGATEIGGSALRHFSSRIKTTVSDNPHSFETETPATRREFKLVDGSEQLLALIHKVQAGESAGCHIRVSELLNNGAQIVNHIPELAANRIFRMYIQHREASQAIPQHIIDSVDLIATCFPDTLSGSAQSKHVLPQAEGSVYMGIRGDHIQFASKAQTSSPVEFELGHSTTKNKANQIEFSAPAKPEQDGPKPVGQFITDMLADLLTKRRYPDLAKHPLAAYERALQQYSIKVDALLGVGAESIVLNVPASKRFPDGGVLKITRPLRYAWHDEWGSRIFDAKMLRSPRQLDLQDGGSAWMYIQEKVKPLSKADLLNTDIARQYDELCGQIKLMPEMEMWDPNPEQVGLNKRGRLVLIDYSSVAEEGTMSRDANAGRQSFENSKSEHNPHYVEIDDLPPIPASKPTAGDVSSLPVDNTAKKVFGLREVQDMQLSKIAKLLKLTDQEVNQAYERAQDAWKNRNT